MTKILSRRPNGQNSIRDLVGQTFGQLTVIEMTGGRCPHGYTLWLAECSCGRSVVRPSYRFLRGVRSCGCGPTGRPRIPNGGAHINALFGHTRTGARARGIDFALTKQEAAVLFAGDCFYCGVIPTERPTHKNLSGTFQHNGIDRIDSSKGYVAGNVVSCCPTCNIAKAQMTVAEFKAWISRAHKHLRL